MEESNTKLISSQSSFWAVVVKPCAKRLVEIPNRMTRTKIKKLLLCMTCSP
jgi:hypothetical protein